MHDALEWLHCVIRCDKLVHDDPLKRFMPRAQRVAVMLRGSYEPLSALRLPHSSDQLSTWQVEC